MNQQQSIVSSKNFNLPNALTMVRIVFVPVLVVFLLKCGNFSLPGLFNSGVIGSDSTWKNGNISMRIVSFLIFSVIIFTDRLDGFIARKYRQVTNLGKIADPIADKFFIGAVFICLSFLNVLPWWITILFLGREILITILRLAIINFMVLPASQGGKLKTILQSIACALYIFPVAKFFSFATNIPQVIMLLALAVSTVTGIDYVVKIIICIFNSIKSRNKRVVEK